MQRERTLTSVEPAVISWGYIKSLGANKIPLLIRMIICDTKGRGHEEGSIKNLPDQHNAGFSSDAKYSLSRANTYNAANT